MAKADDSPFEDVNDLLDDVDEQIKKAEKEAAKKKKDEGGK